MPIPRFRGAPGRLSPAMTTLRSTPVAELRWLARVPIDPMTYRALGYLLLAFPLAIAYFAVLVAGFSLSVGLMVLLVGPVILAATLLVVVAFAWFDGALTAAILGADVEPAFPSQDSLGQFARELFLGRSTWLGLLYLLWKIVLGFVAFVFLVVGLSVGIALLLTPLYYGDHVIVQHATGTVAVDSFPRSLAAAAAGGGLLYASLLAINLLGFVCRRVAEEMLDAPAEPAA